MIGGYVYRGAGAPELAGRYVFSDLCSGNVRTLTEVSPGSWQVRSVLDTSAGTNSFGEDAAGEVYYMLGNGLYRLVSDGAPVGGARARADWPAGAGPGAAGHRGHPAAGERPALRRDLLGAYLHFLAVLSGGVIGLFDRSATVSGTTILGRFPLEIVFDCAALDIQAAVRGGGAGVSGALAPQAGRADRRRA